MQISVENTGPLERKLRVEVPEEKIATEVQNRLQSLSKTTKIQGFRPGKAPIKIVEKHYGSRIRQEVIGEVVQSSFYEALAQEKLQPVNSPTIDPMDAELGKGLKYTATFEIYPDIKLAPVEKLKIEKPVCEISDKDIDKMIEVIRKQQRTLKPVARKARTGDQLTIDFTGTINGENFEGGTATDVKIEPGSKRFIEGFEEGLIGTKSGDKITLDLVFPKEYHKQEYSGKPVKFDVSIKEVAEPVLPELDDSFFAKMGVKKGGLDTFRMEVSRNLDREAKQAISHRVKKVVLDALYLANNKVVLPQSLVNSEAAYLNKQFHTSLQMRGIVAEHQHDDAESEAFAKQASKKVALQLIITEIVKKQQIKVDSAKVRKLIENVAQGYEDPNEVINWYYGDRNRLAEVEALALEDAVVDWVLGQAKVVEKQLPFDDLMNNGQTETI